MSPLMEAASDFINNDEALLDESFNEDWVSNIIPSAPPLRISSPRKLFSQDLEKEGEILIGKETLGQSSCFSSIVLLAEESSVPNEQYSAALVPSESMMQLATTIAHVMGDAQSKMSGSKEEEADKHLQMFHKLKPPLFKGAVGPQAVEDWIMREAFMRLEQGRRTVMQYEVEFTALARYASHLIPTAEEKCYRFLHGLNRELRHPLVPFWIHEFFELVERARLIEIDLATPVSRFDDTRRRRDEARREESGRERDREKRSKYGDSRGFASGSASVVSSGSSECIHCGRRHAGRCYLLTGQCFHCGQQGHRAANCPQKGLGGRTYSGTGQQRTIGSRAYSERSGNRMTDRVVRDSQRETVAPRPPALPPVVPHIYSLQHYEDQQQPESSAGKPI
ncbi:hypothetical protein KFK09_012811 [Dendrobium nobile]|uniref:CCHC-type domain-containing protein n=1 Tax=Dendrobium nobile TaxID=94219 RepID=A0A8T3BIE3_DENNO|nr:hypothetical protein KFK09_012811 [Dendrobium nobile]